MTNLLSDEPSAAQVFGVQTPRILYSPPARTSAGDEAIELAAAFGLYLDPWQQLVLREALKEREDGTWAAFQVGLMVSRQNGKNATLEALELAGLFLFGERLIIHCLAVDTPVLTRDRGWQHIADLTPEDYVFHPSGKAIKVLGKSPIWLNQSCYRVRTADGREVVADADHLWTVCDRRHPKSKGPRGSARHIFEMKTMTTKELFEAGVQRYPHRQIQGMRFALPRQHAIELPERDLPIDPYVFGAWLGDGGSHNATLISHVDDVPHWRDEFERCGTPTSQHSHENHIGLLGGFWKFIKDSGLVGNKHIPEDYLLGSASQREALLQGLMDTDGTAHGGRASFCNTNKNLANGVLFLARSLGWRATVDVCDPEVRSPGSYASSKKQYRVKWTPKLDDGYVPFRMPRKVAQLKPSGRADGRKDGRFTVSIASIEPVESTPVSCIRVDSEDGLFLAGDSLLVTHNSAQLMDTSKAAMNRLRELLDQSGEKFRPRLQNGYEALELTSGPNKGAMVMFRTRTGKGGLGMSADRVIFDEAMDIDRQAIQALVPTLSARPNPQIWYTGSAVDQRLPAHSHCQAFGGVRAGALENLRTGKDSRLCYLEWSIGDEHPPEGLDERKCAEANPGLGYRLTMDKIEAEFEVFERTDDYRGFAVQRYGWGDWPSFGAHKSEIPLDKWRTLRGESDLVGPSVLVLYRSKEGGPWSIAGAQRTAEGRIHMEVGYSGEDPADTVIEHFVEAVTAWGPSSVIVGRGGAAEVIPQLEASGLEVTSPNLTEEAQACGGLLNDVFADEKALSHSDQQGLNNAVSHAVKKDLPSGGFVWDCVNPDTFPQLMGVTLARWGLVKYGGTTPGPMIYVATDEEIDSWLREDDDWMAEL